MRGLSRLFLYVRFFFEADTQEARLRAMVLAKRWCKPRNPHWTDTYRNEYQAFVRSYMFTYQDKIAKSRLEGARP